MNLTIIPKSVIAVVSEVLGTYHTHTKLDVLFPENGAPGDIPIGKNKVDKCQLWLTACNTDTSVDSFKVLGGVLENFMEVDKVCYPEQQITDRERVNKILAAYNLSYQTGGIILGASAGVSTKTLHDILKNKDLPGVEKEFQRALNTIESDPPAGLTAACSIMESLCKTYIEDEGLTLPSDQTIKPLWKIVSQDLGLQPSLLVDDDLKRILSGLTSVVDGLGAIRTHGGSAHDRGRKTYRVEARHARLATHAAHTLCVFIIETWRAKKGSVKA